MNSVEAQETKETTTKAPKAPKVETTLTQAPKVATPKAPKVPTTVETTVPKVPASFATEIDSLRRSPFLYEVYSLICSNVSPARCCTLIMQRHGVSIPFLDILRYKSSITDDEILSVSGLAMRTKNIDLEVDAMGEMARALRVASDRLDTAMLAEELSKDALTVQVESSLLTYWTMLGQYVKLRQSMGEIPSEPLKLANVTYPKERRVGPTLSQILAEHTSDLEIIDAQVTLIDNDVNDDND